MCCLKKLYYEPVLINSIEPLSNLRIHSAVSTRSAAVSLLLSTVALLRRVATTLGRPLSWVATGLRRRCSRVAASLWWRPWVTTTRGWGAWVATALWRYARVATAGCTVARHCCCSFDKFLKYRYYFYVTKQERLNCCRQAFINKVSSFLYSLSNT